MKTLPPLPKQLVNQFGARNRRLRRKSMSYSEFLQSKYWLRIKENVRLYHSEEFAKCNICQTTNCVQLHHRSYTKMFKRINQARQQLVPLCGDCHNKVHVLAKENNWGLGQAVRKLRKITH